MDMKASRNRCRIVLLCLMIGGCEKPNAVLTAANFQDKFNEVESTNRTWPGVLTLSDIEEILGFGAAISVSDPDLANSPPGLTTGGQTWSRWAFRNEVLLVGFANGHVSSVVRLRR